MIRLEELIIVIVCLIIFPMAFYIFPPNSFIYRNILFKKVKIGDKYVKNWSSEMEMISGQGNHKVYSLIKEKKEKKGEKWYIMSKKSIIIDIYFDDKFLKTKEYKIHGSSIRFFDSWREVNTYWLQNKWAKTYIGPDWY